MPFFFSLFLSLSLRHDDDDNDDVRKKDGKLV